MKKIRIAQSSKLEDKKPAYALYSNVDLVIVKDGPAVYVLYGRCHHRGALLADGSIQGNNLVCGLHGWDYRYDSGVSEYENAQQLKSFTVFIDSDDVLVDEDEISTWQKKNPQPYKREEYLGTYQDVHGVVEESTNGQIQALARDGLSKTGHHGPVAAMGVERNRLPQWADIQIQTAQLSRAPLLDSEPVETSTIIGRRARKPLHLDIPLFVSDMSFGALSEEAKVALARGAEMANTAICSGEGGMLPE